MTVATNDTVERYEINGTGPYAYSWRIFNDTDLTVVALSTDDPPEVAPLTYLTHYTVTGANVASGGSITLTSGAATTYDGYTLDIRSNTPQNQITSIRNTARFLPEIHEDAYDYLSRQIQDINRRLENAISVPDNETALDLSLQGSGSRAGKYLAFDANKKTIASSGTGNDSALRTDLASTVISGDGARLIGFIRTETGSAATTIADVLRRQLWLADFGATEDGTTDDSVAWATAIAAAESLGGAEIIVSGDTVLKNVAWAASVSLRCINGARLIGNPSISSDYAITMTGTVGTASALSANAAQGARAVVVASAAAFSVGQYVVLRESTYIDSPDGRKQQFTKITNIVGTTISLRDELLDPYTTAASAELAVLNPIHSVRFTDVEIYNPSSSVGGGIDAIYLADCDFGRLEISGTCSSAAFKMQNSANIFCVSHFHDCTGGSPGSSIGLGWYIWNSHHVHIMPGSHFENLTENSFEFRSRWCTASFTARDVRDSAFNTHGNGNHDIWIYNFSVDGSDGVGIAVGYGAHVYGDRNITVGPGRIANTASHGLSSSGSSGKENIGCIYFDIRVSAFKLTSAGSSSGLYIDRNIDGDIHGCNVDGTTVGNATDACISILNGTRTKARGNRVRNSTSGYGINATSCADLDLALNDIYNCSNNINTTSSTGNSTVRFNTADDTTVAIDAGAKQFGNSWNPGLVEIEGSKTYNPGLFADGGGTQTTVTVTGAALGDRVLDCSGSVDYQGVIVKGQVTAADTVTVRFQNETGGNITIGSHTLYVLVRKR